MDELQAIPKEDMDAELAEPRLLALLFCGYYASHGGYPPSVIDIIDYAYVDPGSTSVRGIGVYLKMAQVSGGVLTLTIYAPDGSVAGSATADTEESTGEASGPDILTLTMRLGFSLPMLGT